MLLFDCCCCLAPPHHTSSPRLVSGRQYSVGRVFAKAKTFSLVSLFTSHSNLMQSFPNTYTHRDRQIQWKRERKRDRHIMLHRLIDRQSIYQAFPEALKFVSMKRNIAAANWLLLLLLMLPSCLPKRSSPSEKWWWERKRRGKEGENWHLKVQPKRWREA